MLMAAAITLILTSGNGTGYAATMARLTLNCVRNVAVFCVAGFLMAPTAGYGDASIERELEYIRGLNELGFGDYASIVLESVRGKHDGDVVARAELTILISQGKFDEANALVAKRPNKNSQSTWAMRLQIADGHYAWSRPHEMVRVYDTFIESFSKAVPENMREFVLNASYRYAQMLVALGQDKRAVAAMKTLLLSGPPKEVQRQIQIEMADLLVRMGEAAKGAERKALFARADEICKDIQWGGQDLWFGRSAVMMAHMRVVEGDRDGARKIIVGYLPMLKAIHQSLVAFAQEQGDDHVLSLTPVAECRYLLGKLHYEDAMDAFAAAEEEEDAQTARRLETKGEVHLIGKLITGTRRDKNAALYHLYNVFVKYPTTIWSAKSGQTANRIIDLLKERGREIKIEKIDMTEVIRAQFKEARAKLAQQDFKTAAEAYLATLALFPDSPVSVNSLADLAECYVELQDELYVELVIEYLADRFSTNPELSEKAGDAVARIARTYARLDYKQRADEVNAFFFSRFKSHPNVPRVVFRLGEDQFRNKVYDAALPYYERVRDEHAKSSVYLDALQRIAYCYSGLEQTKAAITAFKSYIELLDKQPPRQARITSMFKLAELYRGAGALNSAYNQYAGISKLLASSRQKYEASPDERAANQKILEGSMFWRARMVSLRTKAPKKIPKGVPGDRDWPRYYKLVAIKYYKEFVDAYPKSEIAPAALGQVGTLYTLLNKPVGAREALDRLQRDYPDTKEAKNALFILAKNLLELNQKKEAVAAFKQMFAGEKGRYSAGQIMEAGQYLFGVKDYETAQQAFERAIDLTEDARMTERLLLWIGKTLRAKEDYKGAIAAIEKMLALSPKSAYTVAAAFILARSFAEVAKDAGSDAEKKMNFDKSTKAIMRIFKYTKPSNKEVRARADLELADVQVLRGQTREALGSYMRIWLLRSSSNPQERPFKEAAFSKAVPMMLETERWLDAKDTCEEYLTEFAAGKYAAEARKWLGQASINITGGDEQEPDDEDEDEPVGAAAAGGGQ